MKGEKKLKPLRQVVKSSAHSSAQALKTVQLSANTSCTLRNLSTSALRLKKKKKKKNANTPAPSPQENDEGRALGLKKSMDRIKNDFKDHLQTKIGGGKKPKVASQFAKTFDNFLKYSLLKLKQENEEK